MRSQSDRRRLVLNPLAEFFGAQALRPQRYVEMNWSAAPWARGGPGAFPAPGVETEIGREIRRPSGRIHFAGTETATRFFCYMDGAVTSGERAAAGVLGR